MSCMKLNVFLRKAVGTAKGVRIRMNLQDFEFSVLSILGFKVGRTQTTTSLFPNPIPLIDVSTKSTVSVQKHNDRGSRVLIQHLDSKQGGYYLRDLLLDTVCDVTLLLAHDRNFASLRHR